MDERKVERKKGWIDERMYERKDGRKDKWMDKWKKELKN